MIPCKQTANKVSRHMIRSATCVGLVLLMVATMSLGACGPSPTDTEEPEPALAPTMAAGADSTAALPTSELVQPTEEPKTPADAQGDLRIGIVGFPATWDSAFATGEGLRLTKALLDPLVFIGEDLSPVPGLAESWETPDSGKTWDFHLVETSWHDGEPFTAQDVKAHYERLLDPETGSPGAAVFSMVSSVEAPDPRLVRFHLTDPDMNFPILTGQYQGPIQPAHVAQDVLGAEKAIGTGPFMWGEFIPGESLRLVKNPDYFMPGVPLLNSLTFVSFEDERARLNALKSGVIDVAPGIPSDLVQEALGSEGLGISESIPGTMLTVYLRADQEPGNDPRVVEALKISLDREALVDAALRGFGTATPDNPIPPGSASYVDVGLPKRDIERARALLQEAGYEDGLELELYVPVGAVGGPEGLALGIQSMAREAGFEIKVVMMPKDILYAEYWLNLNFGITSWAPRPTLDAQFRVAYTCEAVWNEGHWCNEEFDAMLDAARVTADQAERAALEAQIQEFLAENGTTIIPYHFPLIAAHRDEVTGLKEHPMLYYTDFRRVEMGSSN